MNRPRPCWAPIGIRPEVACQLIREYVYLYCAVSPNLYLPNHAVSGDLGEEGCRIGLDTFRAAHASKDVGDPEYSNEAEKPRH
jgi:hypothetical protein